jgi:endonuclease/exonuclease/phosphatase family metal-dependent hydrolase
MTYNIRSGNGDLSGTVATIREIAPDIVALQEVDVHWAPRSNFADQATELGERLGMAVRFARIYQLAPLSDTMPPREFGVAILSKYPIVRFEDDSLTRLSTQEQNPVPTRMPGLLDATIDVAGVRLRILDTHLDYRADPRVREAQVAEMLNYVGSSPARTILCGDLNAGPSAPELQPLFARLHDAWRSSNDSGFTYPAEQPTKRIDYVLTTPEFRVRSTRVVPTLASDHRPVVAELTLRRPSRE